MSNIRLNELFSKHNFEIPKYQRGYAWEVKNIRELFEDIQEAIDINAHHYIGTVVLSRSNQPDISYVVDGQQRITTVTLIINALLTFMDEGDANFYRRLYIKHDNRFKLIPLGRENEFFKKLLENGAKELDPVNRSQRLLINAYNEINEKLNHVLRNISAVNFLKHIEKLQIMEFIEDSEGDAIRIFQTVNDRGKPLSNMEKAKSLLVYYSNKYLGGNLDGRINDDFGEMFELYDKIKYTGIQSEIGLIANRFGEFNEDNIMRYHFVTFSTEDYDPSASYVFEYLKRELKKLRTADDYPIKIKHFIVTYITGLLNFFKSLNDLVRKTTVDKMYFKLFSILGFSATLYPIITLLNQQNRLNIHLARNGYESYTLLDLLEAIDVRVYKVRGTDPKADMARFAYELANKNLSDIEVENRLLWFNERWMNPSEFKSNLLGAIYKGSRAVLPHILLDYSESLALEQYDLEVLKNLVKKKGISIEHILSQKPKFTLKTHGFKSTEEYLEYEHTLGNITILEKTLNSGVNNKNVFDKISYYDRSMFVMTKNLATEISHNNQFRKTDIEERTKLIAEYMEKRWWY